MIVEVTNLTDCPGKKPKEISLFNRVLSPGDSVKISATYIDKSARTMEAAGEISIGQLPPWYKAFKTKRNGKTLTREEIEGQIKTPAKPVVSTPPVSPSVALVKTEEAPTEGQGKKKR